MVKEGELSREVYVVLEGSAEVYVKWTLPDRTRVGTVSKGAIFGEIELLAHIDNPECKPIFLKVTCSLSLCVEPGACAPVWRSDTDSSTNGESRESDERWFHSLRPAAGNHEPAPVCSRSDPVFLEKTAEVRTRKARSHKIFRSWVREVRLESCKSATKQSPRAPVSSHRCK